MDQACPNAGKFRELGYERSVQISKNKAGMAFIGEVVNRRRVLKVAGGLIGWSVSGCRREKTPKSARTAGALTQEGYVWQRVWTPQVRAGVAEARGKFSGLTVLAAEVDWRDQQPAITRPKLDFSLLASLGIPISLAMRLGPWPGPYETTDPRTQQLAIWLREIIKQAEMAGYPPAEVQVDFDAATAKLEGYQTWLTLLQQAATPIPISFTVLPDWLNSPILKSMARQTGRFVLQVHAVEKAQREPQDPSLIQTEQTKRWVERAAEFGVPFRVALPTYRSVVGFNAEGKIIGIDSEGPRRAWPEQTELVSYVSPPEVIAGLVRDWMADRPAMLGGLLWYRLPVPEERRNWRWLTLEAVMAGRVPKPNVRVAMSGANPVDLMLQNQGAADAPWPDKIVAHLPEGGGGIVAGDALAGYTLVLDPAEPGRAEFRKVAGTPDAFLLPGDEKSLGWLRLDAKGPHHELSISIR